MNEVFEAEGNATEKLFLATLAARPAPILRTAISTYADIRSIVS
jgi:hypothetical protein